MLSIVVCPKRVIYRDGLSEAVLSIKCYLRCLSVWSVRSHSGLSLAMARWREQAAAAGKENAAKKQKHY